MYKTCYLFFVILSLAIISGCSEVEQGAKNPFYFDQQVEFEEALSGTWYGFTGESEKAPNHLTDNQLRFSLTPTNSNSYILKNYDHFCNLPDNDGRSNMDAELHLFKFDGDYYMDILFDDPVVHLPNHHLIKTYVLGNCMVSAQPNLDKISKGGFKFIKCTGNDESKTWNYCTSRTADFQSFISKANLDNEQLFFVDFIFNYGHPFYFSANPLPVSKKGILSADSRTVSYYSLLSLFVEGIDEQMGSDFKLDENTSSDLPLSLVVFTILTHNMDILEGMGNKLFKTFSEKNTPFPALPSDFTPAEVSSFLDRYFSFLRTTKKDNFKLIEPQEVAIKKLLTHFLTDDITRGVDEKVVAAAQAYADALRSLYLEGKTDDTTLLFIQARKKFKIARRIVEELKDGT